jgi:rhamnulokinase
MAAPPADGNRYPSAVAADREDPAVTTVALDPAHPLLAVSHRYGGDPAFVLAGGGNTSFKSADRLWVKASGHALATIGPDGFVELDRAALDRMLTADDWPADAKAREALFIERVMAARVAPERGQRPSVEALLHHLMPEPLVVHTHPGVVNALTCCTRGAEIAKELFGDDVLWQPYVDPGLILARALRDATADRKPAAILLQNHGLIVGGATADAIAAVTDRVASAIRERLPASVGAPASERRLQDHVAVAERGGFSVVADDSPAARWLASTSAGRAAALAGPLTPDQIVYCRSVPLFLDHATASPAQYVAAWKAYAAQFGFEPWVVLVADVGFLAVRRSPKLAEVTRAVYADAAAVCRDAAALGGVNVLSSRDRRFIEEWEVEAHRRAVTSRPV